MNSGQDFFLEDTNKAGEKFPLQYTQENEAMYMLGMYLAPDGNIKYKVKYMHKNLTDWETPIIPEGI